MSAQLNPGHSQREPGHAIAQAVAAMELAVELLIQAQTSTDKSVHDMIEALKTAEASRPPAASATSGQISTVVERLTSGDFGRAQVAACMGLLQCACASLADYAPCAQDNADLIGNQQAAAPYDAEQVHG